MYQVEEGEDEDDSSLTKRRLIFLQNQNFIQTEVRLRPPPPPSKAGGGSGKAGSKGGGGKGKVKKSDKGKAVMAAASSSSSLGAEWPLEFDYSFLDPHYCAALAGLSVCPSLLVAGASRAAVAASHSDATTRCGMVVGLGGGAMPMFLQRYLPGLRLWFVDIDAEIEALATAYFGFQRGGRTVVVVSEGMAMINRLRCRLDAGCSDADIDGGLAAVAAAAVSASPPLPPPPSTTRSIDPSLPPSSVPTIEPTCPLDFLFLDVDSKVRLLIYYPIFLSL